MKIIFSTISLVLITVFAALAGTKDSTSIGAVNKEDWTKGWTMFRSGTVEYPQATTVLEGVIRQNLTLTSKHTYSLKGLVYVVPGITLSIEPGTIIRADVSVSSALIIAKGAKIMAEGTAERPIVFTSGNSEMMRKAGDWGGIVILGNGLVNKLGGMAIFDGNIDLNYAMYGGNNPEDNSGVMSYVRIEYPGKKINMKNELNGLSLAAVGSKTRLDHIMISYSNDDSFEFYGGDVHASHLISYRCSDDDFDCTMGFKGSFDKIIALRHPMFTDFSGSRSLEIDSYASRDSFDPTKRLTEVEVSNGTFICYSSEGQKIDQNLSAVILEEGASLKMSNSVITDFRVGIELNAKEAIDPSKLKITNTLFNNTEKAILAGTADQEKAEKFLKDTISRNRITKRDIGTLFVDIANKKQPNLHFVEEFYTQQVK